MRIAFLLYPTAGIRPSEDTSFWIMHELGRRGHEVLHFESHQLSGRTGRVLARARRSRTSPSRGFLPPSPAREIDLSKVDCVFIRKEPPFDVEYLYALQLLDTIKRGVLVLNDPAGIALSNEKLLVLRFPAEIPDTLVTCDPDEARTFIRSMRPGAVIKVLDEKGGHGVFLSGPRDRSLPSLLETLLAGGRRRVMVQRYLPVERHGDKRVLLLNGRILGAFLRKPAAGDFRANIGVGGSFGRCTLTAQERRLCERISPELLSQGLYLTGIDLIGGKLTEVNVTSPSGVADLITLYGLHAERQIADFVEKVLGKGP